MALADSLTQALTPRMTKYIRYSPTPKQQAFLLIQDKLEVLYGGAAGPGKSWALLMAALQYVDVPGYSALLLRRRYADLIKEGALVPISHEWLEGTDARWDGEEHSWHFPTSGVDAVVAFGYMEHDNDVYQYQSARYQFIGWDELTQFSEFQYRYMFSRARRTADSKVPIRIRSASNPGGVGHEWVKARFVEPRHAERPFIQGTLDDNVHLDKEEYIRSLDNLDPITKAQLLHGDWGARPAGGYFSRGDFHYVEELPLGIELVRFWDLAATDPKAGNRDPDWTAGALVGIHDKRIYVGDVRRVRSSPYEVERLLRTTAEYDGVETPIYFEQEPGASGKSLVDHIRRDVLGGFSVSVLVASSRGSKVALAGPLSSQASAGNVVLVRAPWNTAFLDEAEAFTGGDEHNDQIDAAASAYLVLTGAAFRQAPNRRRVSVGLATYMNHRVPDCKYCKRPMFWTPGAKSVPCPHCGEVNTDAA